VHILLWALQVVLALKFATVLISHTLRPNEAKMAKGARRFGGGTRPLLGLISLVTFVGALALVLPGATATAMWLTPWSAAALAVLMLVGVGLHIGCRDKPNIVPGLVLAVLAAFVAYGRWALAPL
jgi:hypothetical protein